MTHSIKRILCCAGLRGNCNSVFLHAVDLALATRAELHFLHVIKPLSEDVLNALKVNIRDREVLGSLKDNRIEEAQQKLASKLDSFWSKHSALRQAMADQNMSYSVLEGYPASVISHIASREKFDMIIMAANKQRYMTTYTGKVTKGVIKRSKVPVLVVPVAR